MTGLLVTAILVAGLPGAPSAYAGAQEAPDSAELLAEARARQRDFERYRESRLRPAYDDGPRRCDDLVGRLCLIHGDEDDEAVPPEPPEVGMARRDLLQSLADVGDEIPGDRWVLGQRVYYLAEVGGWREIDRLLEGCGSDPWWCATLRGYAGQRQGSASAAEEAFREAFTTMPPDIRARFRRVRPLLDRDGQGVLDDLGDDERASFTRTLWVLSDPLYLVDGNDRLVEHWTRVTGTLIREDAEQAYDLPWGDDLEELLVRYGQEVGFSRVRSLAGELRGRDTRSILGHHDPRGRQFVPPTDVLREPIPTPIDAWHLEARTPFSAYTPAYAPEIDALDAQVGRFRRGDSLLVVAAYRPTIRSDEPPTAEEPDERRSESFDPFGPLVPSRGKGSAGKESPAPDLRGPVESGIFLLDSDGTVRGQKKSDDPEGVWTLAVPTGRYIVGLEVFAPEDRKAWRARGGVEQSPLTPGLAAVSDVLLLAGGEPVPESLDQALPRVLPTTHIGPGQAIAVGWEVYGLRPSESAVVTVGFTRHREGILQRVGQFLRIVETEEPIVVRFEDAAPDRLGTVFRALNVGLPDLEPGEYDIRVEVDLPGRDPIAASRRITVNEPGGD